MDLDTRLLRSFAAVAEEGNLTRAAERLFVSQPALTKQIRQLEARLEVRLFERSRAGMALTDAGRVLAARVPALLGALDEAVQEARSEGARMLRVGFLAIAANEATPEILAAFRRLHPQVRVELRQGSWSDPTAGLARGEADVAVLRLPFPGQERLRVQVLFSEPRWVALPSGHRLADRPEVPFRELWDEPFVAASAETGAWRDFWLGAEERAGHPVRIGAVTEQPDEWLSAIASGQGIALAPAAAARFYPRPGITYRPVSGVAPSTVGVVWPRTADGDRAVRDFVRCCVEVCRRQHGAGGAPTEPISPPSAT